MERLFVGVTDFEWYKKLFSMSEVEEVNFWQPGGKVEFKALKPGELFLFKLHAPRHFIVGGGFFLYSSIVPLSLAWESFGERNGAASFEEMQLRTAKYRREVVAGMGILNIVCILLRSPFFFPQEDWIDPPADWKPEIATGKSYSIFEETGKRLLQEIENRLQKQNVMFAYTNIAEASQRFGSPQMIHPRLGQGSFRIVVTDEYNRRCAVTNERTLPALEAAHIKPFSLGGPHEVSNGILLRSDLHRLLDNGYITITGDYHLEVSRRIREDYENGRDYYSLDKRQISLPGHPTSRPEKKFLQWHNENVFRG